MTSGILSWEETHLGRRLQSIPTVWVDAKLGSARAVYLLVGKILFFDIIEIRGMEVEGHCGDADDGKGRDTGLQTALRRMKQGDA